MPWHLRFWGLDRFCTAQSERDKRGDRMSKLINMRVFRSSLLLAVALTLSSASLSSFAQAAAPPGSGDHFKDTSMFKPPAGARVAVVEFEDLECPACSHAFPIVHAAAAHYKI